MPLQFIFSYFFLNERKRGEGGVFWFILLENDKYLWHECPACIAMAKSGVKTFSSYGFLMSKFVNSRIGIRSNDSIFKMTYKWMKDYNPMLISIYKKKSGKIAKYGRNSLVREGKSGIWKLNQNSSESGPI